jgi:hypothetical protein
MDDHFGVQKMPLENLTLWMSESNRDDRRFAVGDAELARRNFLAAKETGDAQIRAANAEEKAANAAEKAAQATVKAAGAAERNANYMLYAARAAAASALISLITTVVTVMWHYRPLSASSLQIRNTLRFGGLRNSRQTRAARLRWTPPSCGQ